MSEEQVFASYPVFKAIPERLPESERDVAVKEVQDLLDGFAGKIETRGVYSTAAFGPEADLMFWWVGNSPDDIQDVLVAFRKTRLGRALELRHAFLGLVRPAEFAKDHLPAFAKGEEPKRYACVYPFVRTPDWYLLDPKERGGFLRAHGEVGRQYDDVLANTTSAFGLGDYEWILAFEADGVERIVELIRSLRATEARRFTKWELPFITGIRKPLAAAVNDLP